MSALSDTSITAWQDNYTGSDTNSPAGTDSMAGNLDDQLRNIKSVVRLESENKAWFRVLGLSSMPSTSAPTYVSATSFTLPNDWTSLATVGLNQRIKASVTAGTVYGYITAMSFGGGVTTFTVVMDGSSALDSGLSEVQFSALTDANSALPQTVMKTGGSNQLYCVITNGGSGSAFTGTMSPAITAYQAGDVYYVEWTQAAQGADTVNLNSLGAKTVKRYSTTGSFNLLAGEITAGAITPLYYDGTNFQVIIAQWPVTYFDRIVGTPAVDVVNTIAETNLYSKSVPGGTVGSSSTLQLFANGDILNNSGSNATYRIRVYYGGTAVLDTGAVTQPTGSNVIPFRLSVLLEGAGSTSAQNIAGRLDIPTAGVANGILGASGGDKTGQYLGLAVDTTSAQILKVTIQFGTAASTIEGRLHQCVVTYIK